MCPQLQKIMDAPVLCLHGLIISLDNIILRSSLISGPSSSTPAAAAAPGLELLPSPMVDRLLSTPFPLAPNAAFFLSTASTVRWNRLNKTSALSRVLDRSMVLLSSLTYLRISSNCFKSIGF